jgi:phage tail sheath gpL-like
LDIRTPGQYLEVSNERAVQQTPTVPHKALCIGQLLAAGSVSAEVPTLVPSPDAADAYFGRGSILANMCRAFKAKNVETELWAIGLDDDGAAVQATQTITITGTAGADGTIYLYVEGRRITLAVASGDLQNDIATALAAAINLHDDLHVTAGAATNVVTLTARNGGTLGNGIDCRTNYQPGEQDVDSVTVVVAAGVSGATDPDLADAITAMADVQYDTIVNSLADATNVAKMEAELLTRWGPMVQQPGHTFQAAIDTLGNLSTLGNARNSPFSTYMGSPSSPGPAWLWASLVAAVDSKEPDPARPRQTLALTPAVDRFFAPAEADRFTREERNTLLTDGIATHYVDSGGVVRIDRLITTYQTNPVGAADVSYLDVCTLRTLAYLRYTLRTRIALKFPRHKLADDGTRFGPGQAVVTPAIIRAEVLAQFVDWEEAGLVEDWEQFKDDLIVERNSSDSNRVDCRMSPDLMNQFRVFAGQIQFLL